METIVIGHRNPDMDSVCSAVAYAALKKTLGTGGVRAARAGALNERITFVLEKFGVPQPDFLPDVTPRVRDAMVTDYICTSPEQPVCEALALMEEHRLRALPVTDGNKVFRGVISENKLLGFILPPRKAAAHAREVHASLANIASTFDGVCLTGTASCEDRLHALVVAAMDVETFIRRLSNLDPEKTVLFVGDRSDIQRVGIEAGVRAIVVTGGEGVHEDVVEFAREREVTVILSTWDTATTVFFSRGAVVAGRVLEPCNVSFDADVPLAMARRSAVLSNQFIFPVLDGEGRLEGLLSKSDFLKPPGRQLVLVDHNEMSQAVPGAGDLPIVEILDHHRLGHQATETPILFINEPVGSTCTLVAGLYERHGKVPDRATAGLLMAGIISDTLNGTSPTTTAVDRHFLDTLARPAGITAADLAAEIFSIGSPLQTLSPEQVVMADAKEYEENGVRFSVAQVEEVTFAHFEPKRDQLLAALGSRVKERGLLFAALLVTDINTQNSYLLVEGSGDFLRSINYPELTEHTWLLEGVVSRKKQLLPYLTECLARVL